MIGLLASDQTTRNDKRRPLQTPKSLLLPLKAQLPTGTNDYHDSAVLAFSDRFVLDVLVDEWNEVGQSFAAAGRGFGDDVLLAENGVEAADLDVG